MNSKEFILWLRGFVDAVDGIPTQAQWDIIKDKMDGVGEPITWPVGVPNTAPIQTLPFIQPADPYNPYKVYCGDTNLTVATGSGASYGIITNGNTTWTNIPKGANVSYTSDNKE